MIKKPAERKYFRILYPVSQRPSFWFATKVREENPAFVIVVDVSEEGIRLERSGNLKLKVGEKVQGILKLTDETRIEINGVVSRLDEKYFVILLNMQPIPLPVIMREQLRHLKMYQKRE